MIIVAFFTFIGAAPSSVECESTWGPKKNDKTSVRWGCSHQSGSVHTVFTKQSFVHEQVSDMQTSTLSRNKYTRSLKKIKRLNTDNRGYTETFYSMMILLCHQQYGRTDIIGQGHFFKRVIIRNQLMDGDLPWGCISPLPRHMEGKSVEVCLPFLKTTETSSSFSTA